VCGRRECGMRGNCRGGRPSAYIQTTSLRRHCISSLPFGTCPNAAGLTARYTVGERFWHLPCARRTATRRCQAVRCAAKLCQEVLEHGALQTEAEDVPQDSGSVDSGLCQEENAVEVAVIMPGNRLTQGYERSRSEGNLRMRHYDSWDGGWSELFWSGDRFGAQYGRDVQEVVPVIYGIKTCKWLLDQLSPTWLVRKTRLQFRIAGWLHSSNAFVDLPSCFTPQ
jgi:hypothetical protein